MPETLSANVRAFLRSDIESYEQLELLLLLRSEPAREWTRAQLAERTAVPADEVERAVRSLQMRGCITERAEGSGLFRYAPREPQLRRTVDELAQAYEQNRLAIIKLMSANAIERVRNAALDTFADSFVIGRKKDG